MKIRLFFLIFIIMFLSACQLSKPLETSTPTLTSTPQPTKTLTPEPTRTPTITPTPIGGGNGTILYSDGWTLYSIDTNRRNKKLIDENCNQVITFSPNGRYATCSTAKQIDDNNWSGYGLNLIDLKTFRVVKKLTESALISTTLGHTISGEDPTMFSWSPDSKQFVFIGTYNGETGLYIIDIVSSKITLLFNNPNLRDMKWSPNGTKLLLIGLAYPSSWKFNLYVVNIDGTHLTKIPEKYGFPELMYSEWGTNDNTVFINSGVMTGIDLDTMKPNGETMPVVDPSFSHILSPDHQYQFVFSPRGTVFLEKLDGSQKKDLSKDIKIPNTIGSILPQFRWSPNSKMLGFYDYQSASIVLYSVETLSIFSKIKVNQDPSSQCPFCYGDFTWLPDSKLILFNQPIKTLNGGTASATTLSDLDGNTKILFITGYPAGISVDQLTH